MANIDSPSSIKTYNKIGYSDNIKIALFDVSKRFTKPHKHNKYLEIVFFIEGTGYHYLDLNSYKIKPNTLFIIKKDEVHHWEINTEPLGYVVIIKESFLANTLDKYLNIQLQKLKQIKVLQLPKDDILKAFFEALCLEMRQVEINPEVIEGGLKALLSKFVKYADLLPVENTEKSLKFLNLLSEKPINNVSYYSDLLHTTPQNLNFISQKAFNKKASELIAEYLIKEIKRQLIYTNKPINLIAYDLAFRDASNFSKYFKRYTSQTPRLFRKNYTSTYSNTP